MELENNENMGSGQDCNCATEFGHIGLDPDALPYPQDGNKTAAKPT